MWTTQSPRRSSATKNEAAEENSHQALTIDELEEVQRKISGCVEDANADSGLRRMVIVIGVPLS
jgi:NADH dehydrogenase FAD-containing subunit